MGVALKLGWKQVRGFCALGALGSVVWLTGCPFFQCEGKTSCGTSSTSTGSGDYAYVSNATQGSEYISGYTVGTGTLTAITDSPFQISFVPSALQVSPNNNFLFAAATGTGGVYVFTISSTGTLSDVVTLVSSVEVDAMTVSPDGAFLFILTPTVSGEELAEYPLTSSQGSLGSGVTSAIVSTTTTNCDPANLTSANLNDVCSIQVSPSENYVGVALGLAGSAIFTYSTGAGMSGAPTGTIAPASVSTGDTSLAFDESGFVYIARSGTGPELCSFDSLSSVTPSQVGNCAASSSSPRAVTLSTAYNYLFTAEPAGNMISAFTVPSGVPTAFSPATAATSVAPATVSALGVDRSGGYLLAAGYNVSNGLQLFSIASTGLTSVASQGTGVSTTVPAVLALTHP